MPILLILAAAVMWGAIGVFVRPLTSAGMTSRQITAVRCLVNAGCMLILILLTDRSRLRVHRKDFGWFLANGLGSVFVYVTAYQAAIPLTSMPTAVALLYTAPAFVMIFSVLFFRERFTAVKGLSVVLSIAGSALVSGILGGFSGSLPGIGLGLLSGICYALYSIFSVVILKKYHAFTNVFYSFLIAGLAGLFTCDLPALGKVLASSPSVPAWAVLNGVVTGFLAYVFYTVGLSKVHASRAAIYASLEPVVATILGVTLYGDRLDVAGAVGIAMVVTAIVIVNIQPKHGEKALSEG